MNKNKKDPCHNKKTYHDKGLAC